MSDQMHSRLAELEEELNKLKKAVEYVEGAKKAVVSAEKSIKLIESLQQEYTAMKKSANTLIQKIDKIDFPSRLDKMDATISSTNQNISNAQARIESVERNIKDEVKNKAKDLNKIIADNSAEINIRLDNLSKKNKVLIYFGALSIVFLIAILLLQLFKVS